MSKNLYPNWQAICRLADPVLKLLFVTTRDSGTITGLQRGFPHLYRETRDREPRVAFSIVQQMLLSQPEEPDDVTLNFDFGIPTTYFGNKEGEETPVPAEWQHLTNISLRNKVVFVDWMGERHVVVTSLTKGESMAIAPAKCFDFYN